MKCAEEDPFFLSFSDSLLISPTHYKIHLSLSWRRNEGEQFLSFIELCVGGLQQLSCYSPLVLLTQG